MCSGGKKREGRTVGLEECPTFIEVRGVVGCGCLAFFPLFHGEYRSFTKGHSYPLAQRTSVDAIPRLDRTKRLPAPEKMAAEIPRCDSRHRGRANRYSSEGVREGHEARPNVAVDVLFRRG